MIVGIDLGTTFSVCGVWNEKKQMVEIITNEQGHRITPSFISFTDTERLVGDCAKNACIGNVQNTIFDIKRLMGQKFSNVQCEKFPYKIICGDNDNIKIQVTWQNKIHEFTPEEISAMILSKMKEISETYLETKITDAVITVPAYFNDAQRKSTELAGRIAGLNVLRIINEPTAAALAYGIDTDKRQTVLVFDFGGGTLDVTILVIGSGTFQVQSTSGDTHLGGVDLDDILTDWCIQKVMKNSEIKTTDKLRRKIKNECEKAKKQLSNTNNAKIEFEYCDKDYKIDITRSLFENLCSHIFKRCMEPVTNACFDAKINKQDIDKVVLVGGSSRIPKIHELLKEYFGNENILCQGINPDEAVAYGATLQAAKLVGSNSKDMLLVDVNPLSLGIETKGGLMTKIIPRNSTIPIEVTKLFTTSEDNQPSVTVQVYEGERELTKDNNFLGKFDIIGIPSAKKGIPRIEVTYKMDASGILTVSAQEISTGKKVNYVVENKNKLSDDAIQKMISDAQSHKEQDIKYRKRVESKNAFSNYLINIKSSLDEWRDKLEQNEYELTNKTILEATEWYESHYDDPLFDGYTEKQRSLESQFTSVLTKIYQKHNKLIISNKSYVN
jgi:chaperone protein DnaK